MNPLEPINGNAQLDSQDTRGWFLGNFLPAEAGLRHSDDVEMKWGIHNTGDGRDEWVTGETRTTVCLLISGRFKLIFRDHEVILREPGDYVMWGPGTDHRWEVLEAGTALTVRWPSKD